MSDDHVPVIVELLQGLIADVNDLASKVSEIDIRLLGHMEREESQISRFLDAFPDTPQQHREAHQAMIDSEKERQKFWSELRMDLAKKGLWAILLIIVGLLVTGAAAKLGLHITIPN